MLAGPHIAACDGHENCGELAACPHDDDMAGVLEAVYAAEGLILASPVYYENVSSQMKAFIDRNAMRYYQEEWLAPQIVGLIAVATVSGLDETLAALRRFVALSNPREVPHPEPRRLRRQARRSGRRR
jgi:multimeric flavodoxin WrbA